MHNIQMVISHSIQFNLIRAIQMRHFSYDTLNDVHQTIHYTF